MDEPVTQETTNQDILRELNMLAAALPRRQSVDELQRAIDDLGARIDRLADATQNLQDTVSLDAWQRKFPTTSAPYEQTWKRQENQSSGPGTQNS
jgi:hypothetical protein